MLDPMSWIQRKFHTGIRREELTSMHDFLVLWNLYENNLFARNFTIPKAEALIDNLAKNGQLKADIMDSSFAYFQNRYTDKNHTRPLFDHLKFRNNDRKQYVAIQLLTPTPSLVDKALATSIIIYRLRNNLFHGEKPLMDLPNQDDNFKNANTFLMKMMDA